MVDYIVTYVTCPILDAGRQVANPVDQGFYLTNKSVDSKTVFKLLDAQLLVRRVRPNPILLLAHNSTLKNSGRLAR